MRPLILYSCVVDAAPALYHQVMVWAWTAIELARIAPAQLVVHGIDGCDERLPRDLERLGVRYLPTRRHPAGTPMCAARAAPARVRRDPRTRAIRQKPRASSQPPTVATAVGSKSGRSI